MRTIKENAPPYPQGLEKYRAEKKLCEETFKIELITPLYGGGAEAGKNDPAFPIRPSSIRGHLRFWWRATRGARFATAEELFKEEEKIWGSTEKPSGTKVFVFIRENSEGPRKHDFWDGKSRTKRGDPKIAPFEFDPNGNRLYALFSAKNNEHDLVREGLSFDLQVTYESGNKKDVECAIWAWVNFGGIGARTRRGCGALYCKNFAPDVSNKNWWEKALFDKYSLENENFESAEKEPKLWPFLGNSFWISKRSYDNALSAWDEAIKPMKEFRQGDNFAREPKRGLSRWPEPDTIRRWQNAASQGHDPTERARPDGFPRAALGLPITFKFIDDKENDDKKRKENKKGPPYDPDKSQISPCDPVSGKELNRMASPFILKPLAIQGGKQFYAAAILLRTPHLEGVKIRVTEGARKGMEEVYDSSYVANSKFAYRQSPIASSSNGDAIESFKRYLTEPKHGFEFREVQL